MMTAKQRDHSLRQIEGHILQAENWCACIYALGLNPQSVPPGVLLEIGTALEDVLATLRERWMEAAGIDGR